MLGPGVDLADVDVDARVVGPIALLNVVLFALLVTGEWFVWSGWPAHGAGDPATTVARRAAVVLVVTLVCGAAAVLAWQVLRPWRHGLGARWLLCLVAAALAAVPQAYVRARVDGTPVGTWSLVALWLAAWGGYVAGTGTAVLTAALVARNRRTEEARRSAVHRARAALAEAEAEGTRVRKLVADQLHGTVQNRLAVIGAGLDAVVDALVARGDPTGAAEVGRWVVDLDVVRETHVRAASHALFPVGADLSVVAAVRVLLAALPPSVATAVDVRPAARGLCDEPAAPLPLGTRLLVVRAVEEAVTNALKHGARSLAVTLDAEAADPAGGPASPVLRVTVDDDGPGLAVADPVLHGLARHRARIEACGGALALGPAPGGGVRLRFTVPVPGPLPGS